MPFCNFYLKGLKIFIVTLDVKPPFWKAGPLLSRSGSISPKNTSECILTANQVMCARLDESIGIWEKHFFLFCFFVCIVQKRQLVQWPHNSSITTLVIQWPQQQFNDHTSSSMTTTVVYHSGPTCLTSIKCSKILGEAGKQELLQQMFQKF